MNSESKASAGQKIRAVPAETWNGMVDAGNAHRAAKLSKTANQRFRQRTTDIIKVRNDCGADRAAGDVLRVNGLVLTDLTAEHPWVSGTAIADGKPFGILLEPTPDGDFGRLQVSGACLATVDIQAIGDGFADIVAGDYVLTSRSSGPLEILYAPASTGEQLCLVVFRASRGADIYKVHSSGIAARTTATLPNAVCTLQTVSGATLSDTAVTRTLYNLSPNKIEGIDPRDDTSPMYCFAQKAGGILVASPMPWTTQATNIQTDMQWTTAGLDKKRILNMHLPVMDVEDWLSVATREPCE